MLSAVEPDDVLAERGPEVDIKFALDRNDELSLSASMLERWLRRGVTPEDIVVSARV
jgi:hypothetical protein